ncbi:MAG: ABC transporter permease [Puniceicoccales bacterium]|jgi:phospholipid/cholesterol/gamma-HCH transport system permease protein|nr:ABC transporter permease [Puniceicoccales bacterium]
MQYILQSEYLQITFKHDLLSIQCSGTWPLSNPSQSLASLPIPIKEIKKIVVDASQLKQISSPFLLFFNNLKLWTQKYCIPIETINFPESIEKIFNLSQSPVITKSKIDKKYNIFYRIGKHTIDFCKGLKNGIAFFFSLLQSLAHILIARPKNMMKNLLPFIQQTGSDALPIVALISALVGLIMAFVSVVQLTRFGANIYVADLVALAMTREMGCLMTGVIMAGRTGAAFAASIGSMQVNEELDALQTFGINRIHYLVLPRVVALALMMPLLCIFADLIGIIGGMLSALPFMQGSVTQYLLQTRKAVAIHDVLVGLVKSVCFGIILGAIGCYKGIQCGRNATAVGEATTSAVVQGITCIIIADAIFTVLFTVLKI